MARKRERRGPPKEVSEVMESVEQRLDEIHSSDAVIADAQHKQSAAGIPEEELTRTFGKEKAKDIINKSKAGRQKLAESKEVDLDLMFSALKEHKVGPGNAVYSHTSNVTSEECYSIGVTKNNEGFLFIFRNGNAASMKFTPRALEELKWHIDDVLVEMGLRAIDVKSANEHLYRSAPRRS